MEENLESAVPQYSKGIQSHILFIAIRNFMCLTHKSRDIKLLRETGFYTNWYGKSDIVIDNSKSRILYCDNDGLVSGFIIKSSQNSTIPISAHLDFEFLLPSYQVSNIYSKENNI